jgi:hypothetical protein
MVETRIEADTIYQHEQLGEVLVTGIAKMYDEWSIDGPQEDIESGEVLVFYYDSFDGYGGMNPMPLSDPVSEFAKSVEQKRVFEYENASDLRVDDE